MYERFGASVTGSGVEFRLFLPDAAVDAAQYLRGGAPRIRQVRVRGDFQRAIGGVNWDLASAPVLERTPHAKGWLYTASIPALPDGFYQYKYFVEFENGTRRWCTDPCTKYGGPSDENSAFVVGGHRTAVRPIGRRRPLSELVLYELMPDDFTLDFRGARAPFDAIRDKLDYLQELGITAIQFMPWTAWRGAEFSWGYDPFQFFAVEHRYCADPSEPLDRLFRLQRLINELHERDIHVFMDCVINHVSAGLVPDTGFPYFWLYEVPSDSPYIGRFQDSAFFEDLDFGNDCTREFVVDVCKYWISEFAIDGIRFDYVRGLFDPASPARGIGGVIQDLREYQQQQGLSNFSMILEHLPDNRYEAIDAMNRLDADGCWYDPLMYSAFDAVGSGHVQTSLVRALHAGLDCVDHRRPVTYIENHDHSTVTERTWGGRAEWWRTQPAAIALFTASGAPMVHNGQEFGEQYYLPDHGEARVRSRPLRWDRAFDAAGATLRGLYRRLAEIRREHPALTTKNFYPWPYAEHERERNPFGYGVSESRDVVVFHRWGTDARGRLERFVVVLNFSHFDQHIDVPFPVNATWTDLLDGSTFGVSDFWMQNHRVPSHWGRIFFHVA